MMTFYKLISVNTGEDIYIKPDVIDFYKYTEKGVMLFIKNKHIEVLEMDFKNMMILEGVDEYWNTHNTIEYL